MQNATGFDEICAEISKELEWFGLTAFTSLANVGPGNSMVDCLLANTRPEEFSLHYVAKNYIEIDPLVAELRRQIAIESTGHFRGKHDSRRILRVH